MKLFRQPCTSLYGYYMCHSEAWRLRVRGARPPPRFKCLGARGGRGPLEARGARGGQEGPRYDKVVPSSDKVVPVTSYGPGGPGLVPVLALVARRARGTKKALEQK